MNWFRRHRIEIALFVLLFASYAYFVQGGGPSQNSRFALVRAIVENGTFRIDQYHIQTIDKAFYKGHLYCDKAPGLSFVSVPIYWAVRPILEALFADPKWRVLIAMHLATVLTVSLGGAIGGVVVYHLALGLGGKPAYAMAAAIAYGLGTPAFAYATSYMSHQFCAGLLIISFYLLWRLRRNELVHRRSWLFISGFLAALSVASEFPTALIGGALGIYLLLAFERRWEAIWFVAGGVLPALGLGLYNYMCFDSIFASAYRYEVVSYFREEMQKGFMGIGYPRLWVLWQILFGPFRGLLVISPWLVLGFAGFWFMRRVREWKAEFFLFAAIVVVYLLFGASYYMWWGGAALGPRHIVPMLPFLGLPGVLVFPKAKRLSGVLVILSVLIVTMATSVRLELPDDAKQRGSPLTELILPLFVRGQLSEKAVLSDGKVGYTWDWPGHEWDSFNLGEALGLPGLLSLLPLVVMWGILLRLATQSLGLRYEGESSHPSQKPVLMGLTLILIALLTYGPALRAEFIWDDDTLVTENPHLRTRAGLRDLWLTPTMPDYYPLTWTSFWVEWRIWGGNAAGYHLVNVLLHALCAVLLWRMLRKLNMPGAWLAATIFAVHPVNVASVAWVSERKSILAMILYLAAMLSYLRFDEYGMRRYYLLSLFLFALALLSKTSVVILPLILLLCAWWRRERIAFRDLRRSLPFFALSAAMGVVTLWFQQRQLTQHILRPEGFLGRVAGAGWAVWFYASKALFPFNLSTIYPRWQIEGKSLFSHLPNLGLLACLGLCWAGRRGAGRNIFFGIAYFILALSPMLGFFDTYFMRYSLVADHWQYIAIPGIIAAVVSNASAWHLKRREAFALATVAVVVFVVLSSFGCRKYANPAVFWRDTLRKNPKAWVAQNCYGCALYERGLREQGIAHYQKALLLNPDDAEIHNNIGVALASEGKIEEAIAHYQKALHHQPFYFKAHNNLAAALAERGDVEAASHHFQEAIRLRPTSAQPHINFGRMLARQGKADEAKAQFLAALRMEPNSAEAHRSLGAFLKGQNDIAGAIQHYELALRIAPRFLRARREFGRLLAQLRRISEAIPHQANTVLPERGEAAKHYEIASALAEAGRLEEALAHYIVALRIRPDYAEAHNDLANALDKLGRFEDAIAHYDAALQLRPDLPQTHNNIAALLADRGDLEGAIRHYRAALQINPYLAETHNNLGILFERRKKLPEAIHHYSEALKINPSFAEAHYNLASVLATQGRADEAIEHYRLALHLRPNYAKAHNNLGNLLLKKGKLSEAESHYRAALQLEPAYAEAHNNLGTLLAQRGELEKAISCFAEAVRLNPDYANAHFNLALALESEGRIEEALKHYAEAARVQPLFAAPRFNMAGLLTRLGRLEEAIAHYRDMLRARPEWPEALNALAWLLATSADPNIRNGDEAVALAEEACRLTRRHHPLPLRTLAAAYAEAGRFEDAVRVAEEALRLAEARGDKMLADEIRKALQLYAAQKPYRQSLAHPH